MSASEAIARARAIVEAARIAKLQKEAARIAAVEAEVGMQKAATLGLHAPKTQLQIELNAEQQQAVDYGYFGRSFCLIGAAGTGKTTTLRAMLQTLIEHNRLPMLQAGTNALSANTPGVALIAYTRRAVRNIAKQMPPALKSHCLTFHKLVNYAPEQYERENEDGTWSTSLRFAPQYNKHNKLPATLRLVIVDESSMLSIDYFRELLAALPDPEQVQFIFLGDLNQLPPVYGIPILGQKLGELPVIELTRVYRQALESPIIALALAVKNANFDSLAADCRNGTFEISGIDPRVLEFTRLPPGKISISRPGRGRVTLHTWKKKLDKDDGLYMMQMQLCKMIQEGEYNPDEDVVLCPWNTSFGTDELNKAIADYLGKQRGATIFEVISGYSKLYLAVGDKMMIDKKEAIIKEIRPNPKYLGRTPKVPSTEMNRWGIGSREASLFEENLSDEAIDAMLNHVTDIDDRTNQTSHILLVQFLDTGHHEQISDAGTVNQSQFAYAMTVHKAQGSEYRRVFFVLSHVHSAMCSRELVYTAMTRAAEELYVVCESGTLGKAAARPRIKGDTLADKIAFFRARIAEKAENESESD